MRLESVPTIVRTRDSHSASPSNGIGFGSGLLPTLAGTSCLHHQETSLSYSAISRQTIRFRVFLHSQPCFRLTPQTHRQRAQTFACDGTIVRTAICFSFTRQASGSPAWSQQTHRSTTKIALPSSSHTPGAREVKMKWITRKDIKVDRVACPWLIKRFVDPQAEFLFVEERDLLEQAKIQDAIPFDAPKIEAIKLNHRGSRCSFEAILEDYAIADPALKKLALIVRAADVKGQESVAPEGIGLCSIAQGFAALSISDEERLVRQFPVYDA